MNRAAAPAPSSFVTKRALRVWSTVPGADELRRRSRRTTNAFGLAIAASVLVHVATFAVLAAAGWAPGSGTALWSSQVDSPLEVALATTRLATDKSNAGAAVETAPSGTVRMPNSHESAATSPDFNRPTSPKTQGDPGTPGRGRMPRVIVDDRVPRARFDEAFEGGPLADFPREVDSPVALPGKLEVPYPRTALEARREGTVLAWAIVDPKGVVEQTTIVAGPGDFNEAVKATLAKTRLIPARDGGKSIRYYVTLRFEFRIEDRGETTARSGSAPR